MSGAAIHVCTMRVLQGCMFNVVKDLNETHNLRNDPEYATVHTHGCTLTHTTTHTHTHMRVGSEQWLCTLARVRELYEGVHVHGIGCHWHCALCCGR